MSSKPKKKLCWNCEGSVSLKEEQCPYCGAAVNLSSNDINEKNNARLTPPYKFVDPQQSQIPASPFSGQAHLPPEVPSEEQDVKTGDEGRAADEGQAGEDSQEPEENAKVIVSTLAFLICGTVFFLFGWVLLLFSSDGYLELRWNASYWFIYVLIGGPLLFFGFKNLQRFSSHDGMQE